MLGPSKLFPSLLDPTRIRRCCSLTPGLRTAGLVAASLTSRGSHPKTRSTAESLNVLIHNIHPSKIEGRNLSFGDHPEEQTPLRKDPKAPPTSNGGYSRGRVRVSIYNVSPLESAWADRPQPQAPRQAPPVFLRWKPVLRPPTGRKTLLFLAQMLASMKTSYPSFPSESPNSPKASPIC